MNGGAPPAPPPPPRVAGRLTADVVAAAPQYMNCVGLYEIDLRDNKINVIENLGATKNQFDSIDLSDNSVAVLDGFPRLPRLSCLVAANNRIARIGPGLAAAVPGLRVLVLTNNKVKGLQDLDPLADLPKLTHLVLVDNDVARHPQYRHYVLHKLRHVTMLDFTRVKPGEREAADAAMAAGGGAAAAAAATFEPGEGLPGPAAPPPAAPAAPAAPSDAKLAAVRAAIAGAQTLDEVKRLEEALAGGDDEMSD